MTASANREAVTLSIAEHAHRLATVDPDAQLVDLAPLADRAGVATVVGVARSTHGAHD